MPSIVLGSPTTLDRKRETHSVEGNISHQKMDHSVKHTSQFGGSSMFLSAKFLYTNPKNFLHKLQIHISSSGIANFHGKPKRNKSSSFIRNYSFCLLRSSFCPDIERFAKALATQGCSEIKGTLQTGTLRRK